MIMKENLIAQVGNSRNYTLAVAEAMPENKYESKPVSQVWSFRELLNHLAYGIEWYVSNYIKGVEMGWQEPGPRNDKKETIAYLNQAYNALEASINSSKNANDLVNGFYATLDHITHHRGQAVMYLRAQGIKPPEYQY